MVCKAEGDAQVVLAVGGVVGEAGVDVVQLQRANAEAPAHGDIQATAQLHGEGVGGGDEAAGRGEGAAEAMGAAEQRFAEENAGNCNVQQIAYITTEKSIGFVQ